MMLIGRGSAAASGAVIQNGTLPVVLPPANFRKLVNPLGYGGRMGEEWRWGRGEFRVVERGVAATGDGRTTVASRLRAVAARPLAGGGWEERGAGSGGF